MYNKHTSTQADFNVELFSLGWGSILRLLLIVSSLFVLVCFRFNMDRRILKFTGDLGLAETTTYRAFRVIIFVLYMCGIVTIIMHIFLTFILIMAFLGNCSYRAAAGANLAFYTEIEKTIRKRTLGGPGTRWEGQVSHHTAAAVCDACFGDKSIGNTESTLARGISYMSFRPV